MVSEKQVLSALKKCFDPELSVSIVELGLIHDIKIKDGEVEIKMSLTSPFCPMQTYIVEDVKEKISRLKGVKKVNVKIVPGWSPDRIPKKLKKKLGW